MGKTFRPGRGLVALGALAAAVFLAVTAWLHLGWRTVDITLEDRSGDAGKLRGFTLNGRVNWNRPADSLHFSLHDGYLDTELVLDDESAPFVERVWRSLDRTYTVAPEKRAAVDRDAAVTQLYNDGTVRGITGWTDTLCRTYTLRLEPPEGEPLTVRLAAGTITLEEPVAVEAMVWDDGSWDLDERADYIWKAPTQEAEDGWTAKAVQSQPFALYGDWGVCWTAEEAGLAPGLYRMDGLTDAEITALPRDGAVQGQQILCGSTPFGALVPFYCPADATQALLGASMADGSTLLLYLDAENVVWADLVNEAGRRTDHRELGALPTGEASASLYTRTTDRDAVAALYCAADGDTEARYLAALRAEDGRFTLGALLPESRFGNGTELEGLQTAVLNAEGNALLLARPHDAALPDTHSYQQPRDGVLLSVWPLAGGSAAYRGLLVTGEARDWCFSYESVGYNPHRQERYLTFDPLPKDGGWNL